MRLEPVLLFALSLLGTACEGDHEPAGEGTIVVTAYGESFIEAGIPASQVNDGWAIDFSRFEIEIRDVSIAGTKLAVPESVDLSKSSAGGGHELGSAVVPAGHHSDARFTIAHIEVKGAATKGDDETKTFRWLFDEPTRYDECETITWVSDADSATFQITVHADHLFYDSLVATEPQILFQPLADADADADGAISREELAATDIGAYDPGSEGGIDDLWTWLTAQTRTLGHVDGEGHCRAAAGN